MAGMEGMERGINEALLTALNILMVQNIHLRMQ